jgi:ELWxxDGT repeat protein
MRRVGDRVVFFAEDADHGYEPWSTDGTTEGTSLLRDVFPGPLSPFHSVGYSGWLPVTLAASRSQHVFLADDGVHGREPWITDGTPENTRLLADTRPGWQHGYLGAITASDSHVSFTSSSDNQNHFWITDGPTGKARVAHSIATARTEGSEWVRSFDLGNRTLFFAGFDDYGRFLPHDPEYQYHEYDLFVTDGTPQGTARLAQFRSVNLDEAVVLGSRLYFTANDGRTGTEVWVTDGTRAGTVRLTDLDPSFGVYGPDPRELTVLGDWVYFSANDGIHDRELWRTEGTLANTQMVVDLDPTLTEYDDSSNPTDLTSFGGHLYFSAFTPEGGLQLWRTDGTEAGTTVPVDLSPGLTHYPPRDIAVAGGHLYVAGYSRELWKTDGTPEGTFLVHEFTNEDPPVYIVRFAHTTDSSAYFLVDRDDGQVQSLWRTDGTGEGTIKLTDFEEHTPGGVRDIYDFRDVGANELFLVQDVLGAVHLWCTDGTPTGTRFLSDYGSQFFDSRPSLLGVLYQDEFFFRGYSPSNPELTAETWKSNGTASGTESLQRTQPANIFEVWTHSGLVATESGVYFGVNRYLGGPPLTRIFTTTGVPDTTALLDALPTLLTFEGAIGGNLLVRANSPQGDEPHLYRLPEPLVLSPIPNATISEGVPWSYQSLAADPEGRALRFELAPGAPSGLFVNALTGLLTWTPAEWQGPGVYPVTVIVRDPQIPGRQAARSFQIEARESNAPPTLRPLSPTTITVNQRLTFFASAWDTDLPEQSLTYSLDANAPPGAVIDPLTGRFSWTPAAPGSYAINIRVTDNGSPPLSASQTLNLIVQARPGVPNPPGPPVRVVSLTLLPLNRRRPISSLVLLFDGPLHRASAQAKLNYRLALPGPDGLFGTADDRVQRIQSIIYNLRSNIVILRPRTALSRAKTYLLVLNGVKDATGRSIDGDGDGQPGGPFIRYLRAGVVSPALSLWSRSPHSAAHTA